MATNGGKRSRASAEQINHLVDFMVENPEVASGKFQKLRGKEENGKMWSQVTEMLNNLGGTLKTVEQWQTVWRDLKSRKSLKFRERRKQQALTGNKSLHQDPLTQLEEKVLSIVGSQYFEGHECVLENVPMNEDLQVRLESGEKIKVEAPPTSKFVTNDASTPARTPRTSKRKRAETEMESKFLEIASKQADSMKLLAECTAGNAEAQKSIGEGLKAAADAMNNLADAIRGFMSAPQ